MEKGAAGGLRHGVHIFVGPAVQHNIAQLGVPGGLQNLFSLRHGGRQEGRQIVQFPGAHGLPQFRGGHAAHIHQHMAGIGIHGLRLQDGLHVVIVVFQLENVDIPGVRRTVGQIGERGLPGGGKSRVHGLRVRGVQLRIAAVLEDLLDLLAAAGVHHQSHSVKFVPTGFEQLDKLGNQRHRHIVHAIISNIL